MSDYLHVARHLASVRRAWKRAAALAGLAIVCIESIGILTVTLLIDWVYQPAPAVRVVLLLLVVAAVAFLFFRHVIKPLMRRISDEQLAMFVEEHSSQFEGALITATELHTEKDRTTTPKAIIDAVMKAAVLRADKGNVRSAVDLRRLRKYGIVAVSLLAGYGAICLLFPNTIGRHASRVLAPWNRNAEETGRHRLAPGELAPLQITLSKTDSKILRRQTFDLHATLSRASGQPVVLNFRPAGQSNLPWRAIPMKEIEKLNTFAGAIADVDEDTEFCIASGSDRSPVYKIGVYDQLKITSFQFTTRYPDYLQIPEKTEAVQSPDLAVPAGSKVTLKILAGSSLTRGEITWADGRTQALAINPAENTAAEVSFDVPADLSYSYAVSDANGQREQSPTAAYVRALPDAPPTIEVKYPLSVVTANPLGEVTFAAEAIDDLALAGVTLVYQRQLPMTAAGEAPPLGAPVRVPLTLARPDPKTSAQFPDVAQATLRFALEDLNPPAAPEEIISYFLECTDRKGQTIATDIQMIVVDRFDAWPQFDPKPPHGPTFKVIKNITEYLRAAWKLEQQKATLKPEELTAQAKALADSMLNPETNRLYDFYERKRVDPSKVAHADRADKFLESGRQALLAANTAKAVTDFRIVLAELTILKLDKNGIEMFAGDYGKKGMPQDYEKDLNKLFQQVQVEVDKIQPPANWDPKQAQAVEKIRKAAEELGKKQADIVKKAEEIAQVAGGSGKPNDPKDEDKDKEKAKAQAATDAKTLAAQQDKVAAEAQKEAATSPADKAADSEVKAMNKRMADAASAMRDAARNLNDNKTEQAVADAKRAQGELKKVAERLEEIRQEKIAAAVAEAEGKASKLLKEQKELTKQTKEAGESTEKDPAKKEVEFKKLTYRQAQIQATAERLKKEVEELKNVSQRDAKMETAKHLEESHKEMAKSEVTEKMVNAVVELQAGKGKEAAQEQAKAETGLEKVINALRKADESMAADRESQLARAKEEAKRIGEGLKKLGAAADATTRPAPTTGPSSQSAVVSKTDPKNPEKTAATQPTASLTEQEKKALAEDLAIDLERLTRHLADRDFAEKSDQQALSVASKDQGSLANELLKDANAKHRLATIIRRVHDKLEAEYQVTLESKRLQDAQREDCPPAYRQLVNKYYEALAETVK
jgi:hypothetical protein